MLNIHPEDVWSTICAFFSSFTELRTLLSNQNEIQAGPAILTGQSEDNPIPVIPSSMYSSHRQSYVMRSSAVEVKK